MNYFLQFPLSLCGFHLDINIYDYNKDTDLLFYCTTEIDKIYCFFIAILQYIIIQIDVSEIEGKVSYVHLLYLQELFRKKKETSIRVIYFFSIIFAVLYHAYCSTFLLIQLHCFSRHYIILQIQRLYLAYLNVNSIHIDLKYETIVVTMFIFGDYVIIIIIMCVNISEWLIRNVVQHELSVKSIGQNQIKSLGVSYNNICI